MQIVYLTTPAASSVGQHINGYVIFTLQENKVNKIKCPFKTFQSCSCGNPFCVCVYCTGCTITTFIYLSFTNASFAYLLLLVLYENIFDNRNQDLPKLVSFMYVWLSSLHKHRTTTCTSKFSSTEKLCCFITSMFLLPLFLGRYP